jgi:mycothiol synthase
MPDVEVRQPVALGDVETIRRLAAASELADGHPPFGDAVWRDLERPSPCTALVVATDDGDAAGALHLWCPTPGHYSLSVVVDPARRQSGIAADLVRRALDVMREAGGGNAELWAFGADQAAVEVARATGFTPDRELWQMRVELPLEPPVWPAGITVRSFDAARDEDEWLHVNNRAFASDPDQSGWTVDMLRTRAAEPWFDPQGFLLAFDDDGLAGFCWTKVHPAAPPTEPTPVGEIYVIGVDPDRQGTGLGRALVLGGLDSLHARGVRTGMLFVDAANEPAVRLYRALGFYVARADRSFRRDLS